MTAINPGTNGTFSSVDAEQFLIDSVVFLSTIQKDSTKNPNNELLASANIDVNARTFTGVYTIKSVQTINASGQLVISPKTVFTNSGFVQGTGSTFNSATIEGALLEVIQYLQNTESDSSKNPTSINNISGTYNSDTGVFSGSFIIPITLTQQAGITTIESDPYLL